MVVEFKPDGSTLKKFLVDRSRVSIIQGPQGSGKSVAAQIKCWMMACRQELDPDGARRSRWLFTRDTYPNLEKTTIKTHLEWFPEHIYGPLKRSRPPTRVIRDGEVEMEIIFMALEGPEDIRKLRSLELTGAYDNEIQYRELEIFAEILGRTDRYPRYDKERGHSGATWSGIIADMNAPEETHWVPIMRGDVPVPDWVSPDEAVKYQNVDGWRFFVQPAGLREVVDGSGTVVGYRENEGAENKRYLKDPQFYMKLREGKTKSWIDANIMNRPAMEKAGNPVYPGFSRLLHVAAEPIVAFDAAPLWIGLDYGRTPAAVFAQRIRDRWFVLHELYMEDVGATTFAPAVKREIASMFPWALSEHGGGLKIWGDPSGWFRGQTNEISPAQIFHTNGLPSMPATGALKHESRKEPMEKLIATNSMHGEGPRLLIDRSCRMLIGGLQGGYHWREPKGMKFGQQARRDEPEKNKYSHVCEALEYLIYAEEGGALFSGVKPKPIDAYGRKSVFSRKRKRLKVA